MLGALGGCGPAPERRNYKLVVYVETPEGLKTGSSVVEVKRGHDIKALGWMGAGGAAVSGEAVAVDLPHGQTLWMLLANAASTDSWGTNLDVSLPAPDDEDRKLPAFLRADAGPHPLKRTYDGPLTGDQYPYFVRFRHAGDPLSMEVVDPDDLAASFGKGYRLARITVQGTDEPVTRKLSSRLPAAFFDRWTQALDRVSRCGDVDHPFMRQAAFSVGTMGFSLPFTSLPGDHHDPVARIAAAQAAYRGIPCNKLIPGYGNKAVRRYTDTPVFSHHADDSQPQQIELAEWTRGKAELGSNFLGTLTLLDGCLALAGQQYPMLMVFPSGEAHWNQQRRLLHFKGKTYAIGDKIYMEGVSRYLYVDGGKADFPDEVRTLGDFDFKTCNGFNVWLVK